MSIYNEGWQKKASIAQRMHERGQQSIKEAARADKAEAIAVPIKEMQFANPASPVSKTNASDIVRASVQTTRESLRVPQKPKEDLQLESARREHQASSEFVRANVQAKEVVANLKSLSDLGSASDVATRRAVEQKGELDKSHLTQRNANQSPQQMARVAGERAANAAARQKAARHISQTNRPTPKGEVEVGDKILKQGEKTADTQATKYIAGDAAQIAQAAAGATKVPQITSERPQRLDRDGGDAESGKDSKKSEKGAGIKGTAHAYAAKSGAGQELGALLGGNSGGHDRQNPDAHDHAAEISTSGNALKVPLVEELPEVDPHRHIFSDATDDEVGLTLRASLYSRYVEKRLNEIAMLDGELEKGIVSLSKRIIAGDEGSELADALKTAMFQRKSVYGGMIG